MITISCVEHGDMEVRSIDFSDDQPKFLCDECIINYQYQQKTVNLEKILYFTRLFDKQTLSLKSQPEYILSKLNNIDPKLIELFNSFSQNDEQKLKKQWIILDKQIEQMLETLVKVKQELQTYINQTIINRNYLLDKLNNIIQFDELKQIVTELNTQTSSDSDSKNQIEERFKKYFIDMQSKKLDSSIYEALVDAFIFMEKQDLKTPNFKLFQKQTEYFFKDAQQSLEMSKPNQHPNQFIAIDQSNILRISSLYLLRKNIQNKTGKSVSKISKLNNYSSYFQNRSNLLIVLKLQNQKVILGGFSPCSWNYPSPQFLQQGKKSIEIPPKPQYYEDETVASFLFSDDQEQIQIFNLKENCSKFAIYCDQNEGPIFGAGHDLYINSAFQRAVWNPEGSYEIKKEDLNGVDQELEIETYEIYSIQYNN